MKDPVLVKEWLLYAKRDYDSALFLFENMHPKPIEIVCYLCQQSAEKSIKAFLVAKGIEPPKTHDIGKLCELCAKYDKSFLEHYGICEKLTYYASNTRYPNKIELLEYHSKSALSWANTLYDFTNKQIDNLS